LQKDRARAAPNARSAWNISSRAGRPVENVVEKVWRLFVARVWKTWWKNEPAGPRSGVLGREAIESRADRKASLR
jgi:hypothetical protein